MSHCLEESRLYLFHPSVALKKAEVHLIWVCRRMGLVCSRSGASHRLCYRHLTRFFLVRSQQVGAAPEDTVGGISWLCKLSRVGRDLSCGLHSTFRNFHVRDGDVALRPSPREPRLSGTLEAPTEETLMTC